MAPDGTLTRAQSYDVYGCVRTTAGQATTRHKFVGSLGHPSEDETGLVYMRARYYDPVTGRFASEDLAGDGGNWFAYCGNDPVSLNDPTGKARQYYDLGSGYWIGIDDVYECGRNPDGSIRYMRDAHYGRGNEAWGSIRQDGIIKHGRFEPNSRMKKALRERGFTIAAISSIDAYFQIDPLDFVAILFTCSGMFDAASAVDEMNGVL